jgi:DNA-binding NtrC family response regulator
MRGRQSPENTGKSLWAQAVLPASTMSPPVTDRVLVVDDDPDQCTLLASMLGRLGYGCDTTTSPREALDKVSLFAYSAVLTDLEMAEMSGIELSERLLGTAPDVPVVVVTGHASMETAISAMRVGAYDYLVKPVDAKLLGLTVARAVQHARLKSEVKRLREEVSEKTDNGLLLGESTAMRRVSDLIHRVAGTDASVLIQGETGTGKELIARAIHDSGPRSTGPFVAINCAAVPANLLESELFGHAKGAFTDAKNQRSGLFIEASGGTLFLDEIGEMPMDMQAKLLRALQERTVRPVGANSEVPFDARILAATHRDLETETAERRFRQDLYYRINVVRIDVPPLRERGGDILKLAVHFLDKFAERTGRPRVTLSSPVAERLLAYDWPGNVRELENCMERVIALARYEQVTVEDLPEKVRIYRPDRFVLSADQTDEVVTLDELERRYILRVIKLVEGNKSRAAQLLGLDRRTLYRKLDRYRRGESGIEPEREQSRLASS